MGEFFISPLELQSRLGAENAPPIFDVRRWVHFDQSSQVLPTAEWRDHLTCDVWGAGLPSAGEVVVYCVHGHNVSQTAAAALRARGVAARVLKGGIEAWKEAGAPLLRKDVCPDRTASGPSIWVSSMHLSVDVCLSLWFVRRFVDTQAHFLFVEPEHAVPVAEELGGSAMGVVDARFTAEGGGTILEVLMQNFAIADPSLEDLSRKVQWSTPETATTPLRHILEIALKGAIAQEGRGREHGAFERIVRVLDTVFAGIREERSVVT